MRLMLILLPFFFIVPNPAYSADQKSAQLMKAVERIDAINKRRPEQNNRHERAKDVLSARVLDRTNRVIGEVRNVILDRNGTIAFLNIEFNRMQMKIGALEVNYRDLGFQPVTNGYKMSYTDDQIEALAVELLANIETASGPAIDKHSLKALTGKNLHDVKGQKIAIIEDILFDNKGSRAELLLISMQYNSLSGKSFAIPFAELKSQNNILSVRNSFFDAMKLYAQEN